MAHDHAHIDPESGDRRVSLAIWANALLTVAQIVGGVFAGSLALIADALHNFSDMASLVIAFVARKIARRPADAEPPPPVPPPQAQHIAFGSKSVPARCGEMSARRATAHTHQAKQGGREAVSCWCFLLSLLF